MISSTKLGTILIILAAISYLTVGNYTQTLPWVGDLAPIVVVVMLGGALFFVLISWTYDLWKSGWL